MNYSAGQKVSVEQGRRIFSYLNEWEMINYIAHVLVHFNTHQLCNFKAAV